MAVVALQIQLARGMLGFHFGVFVTLAFLLAYRHWAPILTGAAAIAVHHILFDRLQAGGAGVYCLTEPGFSRVLIHAGYVVGQAAFELLIALQMYRRAVEQAALVSLVEHLTAHERINLDTQHVGQAEGTAGPAATRCWASSCVPKRPARRRAPWMSCCAPGCGW